MTKPLNLAATLKAVESHTLSMVNQLVRMSRAEGSQDGNALRAGAVEMRGIVERLDAAVLLVSTAVNEMPLEDELRKSMEVVNGRK